MASTIAVFATDRVLMTATYLLLDRRLQSSCGWIRLRASLAHGWICEIPPTEVPSASGTLPHNLLSHFPVHLLCGRSGCEANETDTDYRYLRT